MLTSLLLFHSRQSALVAACLLTAFATNAIAETFPLSDVVPASVPKEQRDTLQSQAQELANGMYGNLLLRLDEVDRVCELSNDQIRHLTIAAKGAVQQCVDVWLATVAVMFAIKDQTDGPKADGADIVDVPMIGLARLRELLVRGANGEVQVQVFFEPIEQRRGAVARFREVVNGAAAKQIEFVINQEAGEDTIGDSPFLNASDHVLWKASLERTLNDDQKTSYAAAQVERQALPKEWRHERVMVAFDRMLRLDRSQRKPLAERVDKFLEMSQIKLWLKRRQGFEDEALAKMALRAIPTDDVKDFLSDRQLEQWKLLLRQDLESR